MRMRNLLARKAGNLLERESLPEKSKWLKWSNTIILMISSVSHNSCLLILYIVGSVPYGLPCIATTRRTLDLTLKNKQIEMINDKICRIMREPREYVNLDEAVPNSNA